MAVSLKKPSKSESLTIRLDPKTRFMLEFVSRLKGQTITTVVERAIGEAANRALIEQPDEYGAPLSWRDFWSLVEGERAIKIAGCADLHPTYEEERRLAFTKRFWPFFYHTGSAKFVRDEYVEVLWGRIDYLIEVYEQERESNANAAPEIMSTFLEEAKIKPPQWPPREDKTSGGAFSRALNEEDIPF